MKTVTLTSVLAVALVGCSSSKLDMQYGEPAIPDLPAITEPGGPGQPEPFVCGEANASFEDVVPTVMLVVDRSGSMTSAFGTTSRWAAVYRTLMGADGVVTRLEDAVRFGLTLYHSDSGFAGGTCPMLDVVAPGLRNATAIDDVYAPLGPAGDTPTGSSIAAASSLVASEPGPRFLVLATDGLPDTCELPNPDGHAQARADAITATQQAFVDGTPTYVLSVGPDVAEDHLQAVANAGSGLDPEGADSADYYVALDPDSLVDAFDDIMDGVRFCTFTLDDLALAEAGEEGAVVVGARVTLDGQELVENQDWRLVGTDAVQLVGGACDQVLEGGDHQVEAQLLCETQLR